MFQNLFLRLGGYSLQELDNEFVVDRPAVTINGVLIFMAALMASINWGLSAYQLTAGADLWIIAVSVPMASIAGALFVIAVDLTFILALDTMLPEAKASWKIWSFLITRAAIVILIGSVSSQGIVATALQSDTAAKRLELLEKNDTNRFETLNTRYDTKGKSERLGVLETDISAAEKALVSIPPGVTALRRKTADCWALASVIQAKDEKTENDLLRLGRIRQNCMALSASAAQALAVHKKSVSAKLAGLTDAKTATREALVESETAMKEKLKRAEELRPKADKFSAAAYSELLKDDPAALFLWLTISALILLIELLPSINKALFQTQSSYGLYLAVRKELSSVKIRLELESSSRQTEMARALTEASARAVSEALNSTALKSRFRKVFSKYVEALAPKEALDMMIRELETTSYDVGKAKVRYPRYAEAIEAAWTRTVREMSDILSESAAVRQND